MAYLNQKHNSNLLLNPIYPEIGKITFNDGTDQRDFYGDATKAIPLDALETREKVCDLGMMDDSDHAGEKATRRSRTSFLIYVNMSLITWLSKVVAIKTGMESLHGLRYNLQMIGVPLTGLSYIYGDNVYVIHSTHLPESTLKKKKNSICYHLIRESVSIGDSLTSYITTTFNLYYILTKALFGQKNRNMV